MDLLSVCVWPLDCSLAAGLSQIRLDFPRAVRARADSADAGGFVPGDSDMRAPARGQDVQPSVRRGLLRAPLRRALESGERNSLHDCARAPALFARLKRPHEPEHQWQLRRGKELQRADLPTRVPASPMRVQVLSVGCATSAQISPAPRCQRGYLNESSARVCWIAQPVRRCVSPMQLHYGPVAAH